MAESPSPGHVVWLGGMPRSGSSWLAQILASHPDTRLKLCPLFSYEFKNALDRESSLEDWNTLFADVYRARSDYLDQDFLRRDGLVPGFVEQHETPAWLVVKSVRFHELWAHAVAMGVEAKTLYIVRDPIDCIASWVFNEREFPAAADIEREWRSGACRKTGVGEYWGFDDWLRVTQLHVNLERQYPERVRLVAYDDLARAPQDQTDAILGWLGLDQHDQTTRFIEQSRARHSDDPRAVFKDPSELNQLHRRLPDHIVDTIRTAVSETSLARFLRQPEMGSSHG